MYIDCYPIISIKATILNPQFHAKLPASDFSLQFVIMKKWIKYRFNNRNHTNQQQSFTRFKMIDERVEAEKKKKMQTNVSDDATNVQRTVK